MNKTTKILLLFILGVVFACILYIWVTLSPTAAVYSLIYDRSTEVNLALSFATALSTNHPAAYDMIDPALRPRLDGWMTVHQKIKCTSRPEPFLVGSVTETAHSYSVYFSCFGVNGRQHSLDIEIVIEDMKVISFQRPFE